MDFDLVVLVHNFFGLLLNSGIVVQNLKRSVLHRFELLKVENLIDQLLAFDLFWVVLLED